MVDIVKTFITFIETENVSRTAEVLNISQPAVTHQLKIFEDQFHMPIFTYSGRRKIPTRYGRHIYEIYKNHYQDLKKQIDETNKLYLDSKDVTLRIGMRTEVARKMAPYIIFPGKIIIETTTGSQALELLEERKIDLAITERPPNKVALQYRKLFKDSTVFITHKEFVAGKPPDYIRSQEFLKNTAFLAYKKTAPFLDDWLQGTGLKVDDIKYSLICQDWYVVIKMTENKRGWSIIPNQLDINTEVLYATQVPLHIIPETQFYAYFYPEFSTVPAYNEFLDSLERNLKLK